MKILPVLLLLAFTLSFSVPLTELTIQEDAGVDRLDENITMGVPIPENLLITDSSRFALRDEDGSAIPCGFSVACRWVKHPEAIRWLHLNFPYSIAADGKRTLTLHYEESPGVPASRLTVAENATGFTVNTGRIRFTVRKRNFNVLDQVWIDETGQERYGDSNQIVASHDRGVIELLAQGEYASGRDTSSRVVMEKRNPGMVCLKATGFLRDTALTPGFFYTARIYAFDNSRMVKVYLTFENRAERVDSFVRIRGFNVELPLNLSSMRTAAVGTPGGFETKGLSASDSVYCLIKRTVPGGYAAIRGLFGGVAADTFDPRALKPRDVGWISLSDGTRGCAMSARYFWQMCPSSMEARGDGRLVAGIYAERAAAPLDIYSGVARSKELRFVFFNHASPDTQRSRIMGGLSRLYALATPYWYCRRTNGLGKLSEYKPDIYSTANWGTVINWRNKYTAIWNTLMAADDNYRGYDSYGFLTWGDNPHASYPGPAPYNVYPWIYFNSNYYGLDQVAFYHFALTPAPVFLDYAAAHAEHVQDVHCVHFGEGNYKTGGNRYCPPVNHVAADEIPPLVTVDNPSHHKTEGLFSSYYLLGNDRALDVGLEGVGNMHRQGIQFAYAPGNISDNLKTYVRRLAHQMFTLVQGYEYSRNEEWLLTMRKNWACMKSDFTRFPSQIGQGFMVGLCMEACVKMHGCLPDSVADSIPLYLKKFCDAQRGRGISNVTLGYAFLSRYYGPTQLAYATQMGNALPTIFTNLHKDFADGGRNVEQAIYYYAKPESLAVAQVANELAPSPGVLSPGLALSPNPFSPSASVTVALKERAPIKLSVYDPSGRLVRALFSGDPGSLRRSFAFDARTLSNGLYCFRLETGGKVTTRRALLLR